MKKFRCGIGATAVMVGSAYLYHVLSVLLYKTVCEGFLIPWEIKKQIMTLCPKNGIPILDAYFFSLVALLALFWVVMALLGVREIISFIWFKLYDSCYDYWSRS